MDFPVELSETGALFSDCRTYRYWLWRVWDTSRPLIAFIGLNPSKANETDNDATMTRLINFAKSWGFGGLIMLNLFAFCETSPKLMKQAREPIGPHNDAAIIEAGKRVERVVFCWGNDGLHLWRGAAVKQLAKEHLPPAYRFGLTGAKQPKHPLYLKNESQLELSA